MHVLPRILPPALVLLLLSGCVTAEGRMLAKIWPKLAPGTAVADAGAPPTPYYCYRNIGKVDCYVAPDPQRRQ
jgi:hypothetical protein